MEAGNGSVVLAKDVSRRYGEGETAVDALRGVSVDLARGKATAVMGPSGSGKSTLMHGDEYGRTIVIVTHDARAAAVARRVLFLADGAIVHELAEGNQKEAVSVMEVAAA